MQVSTRRAITLLELLVVIIILVTLTAALLPVLSPAVGQRRMREAARGLSNFIAGAQARALRNGRPVGIRLEKLKAADGTVIENGAVMVLTYVEMPAPFGGFGRNATVRLQRTGINNGVATLNAELTGGVAPQLIKANDLLQVNYQGYFYRITDVSGNNLELEVAVNTGMLPWPNSSDTVDWGPWLPFQIYRMPESASTNAFGFRSSGDVFQLPDGIVIDLAGSGFNGVPMLDITDTDALADGQAFTIMFFPSGGIESTYGPAKVNGTMTMVRNPNPPGPLYLLLGLRENVDVAENAGDPLQLPPLDFSNQYDEDDTANTLKAASNGYDPEKGANTNWLIPSNLWVTVSHQTGQVTTESVAPQFVNPDDAPNVTATDMATAIFDARRFARDRAQLGGNSKGNN